MFLFQSRRVTSGWTMTRTRGSGSAVPTPPSPPSPAPSSWTTLSIWRGRAGSPTIRRSSSRAGWLPRRRWCRWAPQKPPSGKSGVVNWMKITVDNKKKRPQIIRKIFLKNYLTAFFTFTFSYDGRERRSLLSILTKWLAKRYSRYWFPSLKLWNNGFHLGLQATTSLSQR